MNDENRRISELATRMKGYFAGLENGFPANSVAGQRITTLGELDAKISGVGSKQAQERNAAKAAIERKGAFLDEIKRRMKETRRTAVSCDAVQPGVSQHFNLPSSNSEESWLEAARAYIAAGTTFKPLLLGREMPEDFLDGLSAAIEGYESAVDDYNTHARNASAATSLLEDACAQVLAIRRELDPMVRNRFRDDPEKLAQWEAASHLERAPKRAASKKPNGGPTDGQT